MRPTLRAVVLCSVAVPVALVPVLVDARLWTVWLAVAALVLVAIGLDAVRLPRPGEVGVTVDAPEHLFIGGHDAAVDRAHVRLRGPAGRRLVVEVLAELDSDLAPQPRTTVALDEDGLGELGIELVPRRRGRLAIRALWLRWRGPLGLVARQLRSPVDRHVDVLPNVRAVKAAAIRFFGSREAMVGLKVERFLGDGSEFESLREYVAGMDHRAIDWKSSARHVKLLCQEFRAERNHQLVLAVDTGHLMREPLAGVPRLDHAINAALLLGYVGLRTGDRVGLFGFDARPRKYLEPVGGATAFPRLQGGTAELAYTGDETNFTLGLAELSTRLRRRSLVVVLTEFVDVVTAQLMVENLERLARRHVVVFVALRDPSLDAVAGAAPREVHELHRAVVAADFVREREVVLRRLQRLGITTIDAPPAAVSSLLLNRYLDIKRRERV